MSADNDDTASPGRNPGLFRVFAASPGDLQVERDAIRKVIDEINQTHGPPLGYRLELWKWETHAAPGAGRPQEVINEQIGKFEVFVGMMWRRFGTPTGVAGSGTEEEFMLALDAWEKDRERPLMFYFCQKPFMPRHVEELDQIRQVLLFRQRIEKKALVWDYAAPEAFADEIRKHLCLRMTGIMERKKEGAAARAGVGSDEEAAILSRIWPQLDPKVREAFAIAYNENRKRGDGGVGTSDLFSALMRVMPKDFEVIVEEIPKSALPEPTVGPVVSEPYVLEEKLWLSGCVRSSLRRLTDHALQGNTLTATDVFADIAKHGTGKSVQRLREHKITPEGIDRILQKHNVVPLT